ncbi:MAG: hypothetical protein WBX11_16965 [Thiobacillaceae bacterium]
MPNYPAAYSFDPNEPQFQVDPRSLNQFLQLLQQKERSDSPLALALKHDIEMALAELPGLEDVHDKGPRIANVRAELLPVAKAAEDLGTALDNLSDISKSILESQVRGLTFHDLLYQVTAIEDISLSAVANLKKEDGRHGATKHAQRMVGARLVEIFDKYSAYASPSDAVTRGILRDNKREFIDAALSLAEVRQSDRLLEELVP